MSALDSGLALVGTLDLEDLRDRLLAALTAAAEARGGAVWIADEEGDLVLRGPHGPAPQGTREEEGGATSAGLAQREALPSRFDPREGALGAALLRGDPFEPEGSGAGGALLVPLVAEGEAVGMVLLEGPARSAFGPEQRGAAAELARYAGVAVRNALRLRAGERAGLRDRESGAYHLGYFVDYAGKEFYKSRRYGRSFSLAVLGLENLADLRRQAGREALRAAARALVAAVSRVARDADIVARASDREHYVLLPETDHFGALMFQRRALEEIRREAAVRALEERCPVLLSLGAATFPNDGEDFDALLDAGRARQAERRSSLLSQLGPEARGVLGPAAFWELADVLLRGAPIPAGSPSARLSLDPDLFDAVRREAAREIGRGARTRGVLYVACPDGGEASVVAALPRLEAAARSGDTGSRVYVLGPRAGDGPGEDLEHPLVTRVFVEGDRRLQEHAFLLFLSERAAYAFLQGPDGNVFHTSDLPLVDALVAKLQAHYDLQPV